MLDRPRFWRRGAPGAAVVRGLLTPLGALYAGVMRLRNLRYDLGWAQVTPPPVPTVSVGNLSVGGTGKTPVTAHLAAALVARGLRPGIVLRGVGGDEAQVLAALVPEAVIEADADRVAGCARAVARGAQVLVLDDAFQHRRAGRSWDVVLCSADAADEVDRVLPAGPLREPWPGLRRADAVLITRKAADDAAVADVVARVRRVAADLPTVVVGLLGDQLVPVAGGAARPLATLAGTDVLAVSGIGAPQAFERQLVASGARVTGMRFRDHHAYGAGDVAELLRRIPPGGMVVCTLKDAVKLGPRWPDHAPPLWYLSQRLVVERGAAVLTAGLTALATQASVVRGDRGDPLPSP